MVANKLKVGRYARGSNQARNSLDAIKIANEKEAMTDTDACTPAGK